MNVLCSNCLLAATLSSTCITLYQWSKKLKKNPKLIQVFVHYVIQTSYLSKFVIHIKDIIMTKINKK